MPTIKLKADHRPLTAGSKFRAWKPFFGQSYRITGGHTYVGRIGKLIAVTDRGYLIQVKTGQRKTLVQAGMVRFVGTREQFDACKRKGPKPALNAVVR